MRRIRDILFQHEKPHYTGFLWAKPEGDSAKLLIHNNGEWVDLIGGVDNTPEINALEVKVQALEDFKTVVENYMDTEGIYYAQ